ncbi:MAG: NAD(P)H-dependent oxidoreductase subunit E [Anaerolineales bacterium]|nr:NAD(P)H-dependent oxidoreductase subunit E [Anaerolineales bacterium]
MINNEELLSFTGFSKEIGDLIPLLQTCQKQFGYISENSVRQIAHYLNISENHIYGVASFYSQFRFKKPGDNCIRVCLGTACHVQGSQHLSDEIKSKLGIEPGETTPDNRFDYEEVACLGCCAQASVVEINGKIFGKMTPEKLGKIIQDYE